MLSFKDNFFFLKFAFLFFVVTIFGYWGIDLNSEELYIAFSFFFLVVLAFLMSRVAVILFFSKTVNRKYSRLLSNFVRIQRLLTATHWNVLKLLAAKIALFWEFEILSVAVTKSFFKAMLISQQIYSLRVRQLFVISTLGTVFNLNSAFRLRKFTAFSNKLTHLFSITI